MIKAKIKVEKNISNNLETDIYNIQGQVISKLSLPSLVFAVKINPTLMAQAVRIYQANQRMGTHSTKTRGEVTGSTRKIYRQKGTGRARHGDIKSPIFIGGGVVHGPRPKDYSLDFPKKMRKLALFSALTSKYQTGAIKIISGLEQIEAKTKQLVATLNNLKLVDGKKRMNSQILLVTPGKLNNILLAGRNINYLTIRQAELINTYEVLSHHHLLLMKDTIMKLTENFISHKQASKIKMNHQLKKAEVKSEKIIKSKIIPIQKPNLNPKKSILKKKTSISSKKRISNKS